MADRICMGCMEKYDENFDVCPCCGYKVGTPPKEMFHLKPGTVLQHKYIVGKSLGYGGFGITYIGYDDMLQQKVAIKEYMPSDFATRSPETRDVTVFSGDPAEQFAGGIQKFVDEARRLAKFKNISGIVGIYDSFMENNTAYIVMEYLQGETLKSRLEREEKLSEEEAVKIIMPVLEALKEVHKEGIIHRDIAPDNIFLTESGEVKLLDFGAARYATTTHSKSLSVIIKPGYAPQEQYRSRGDQGSWTDVYACAATLYRMITGVVPEDSMERGEKDTLVLPSKLGVKISKNAETAIMNALNLKIEDRTQTAEEFETELMSDKNVRRRKVSLKKTDIGRWPVGVKIGVAAAMAAVVVMIVVVSRIPFANIVPSFSGELEAGKVYVPNLVNSSYEEAKQLAAASGVECIQADVQKSDIVPKDYVLQQSPADGQVVDKGTTVELVMSEGKDTVEMLDMVGFSETDVQQQLTEKGLFYTTTETESVIAPGYVVKQTDSAGQELEAGSSATKTDTIQLSISTGMNGYDETVQTKVPKLKGKSWDEALEKISEQKLYICKKAAKYSMNVPEGEIISQEIKAGEEKPQGTIIEVTVSLGVEKVKVPSLRNHTNEETASLLSEAGLNIEVAYEYSDDVKEGLVIRQSIDEDTEVDKDTTVTVWISLGKESEATTKATTERRTTEATTTEATTTEKITTTESTTTEQQKKKYKKKTTEKSVTLTEVPSVIGMSEADARSTLSFYGLGCSVTYVSDESGASGTVLSQSVSGGSSVAQGTTVAITVCD